MNRSYGSTAEFLNGVVGTTRDRSAPMTAVSGEFEIKAPPRTLLPLGGEMRTFIREKDWSQTSIGPMERWSPTLKTMVELLLANRFPLLLWWGPQYVSIYNDAYRPILGAKHPAALGKPFREVWPEIEQILSPLIDAPFKGGPSTWMEDILLEVNRHGFFEETHFTIAYSPVPDETAPRGIVRRSCHGSRDHGEDHRRAQARRPARSRRACRRSPNGAASLFAGSARLEGL